MLRNNLLKEFFSIVATEVKAEEKLGNFLPPFPVIKGVDCC